MVKMPPGKYTLCFLTSIPFSLCALSARDAFSAPLLMEVVQGVYPATRGFLTLFDVTLILLIMVLLSRKKRHL
ncbi:MAG: hypothetical protein GTN70_06035 [Deltaproteobacteria bacterium]|nr:hypothetical protein [Deltaproteobacteria bacterium]NIS77239.1 hypothetical protein [Deltaproteobacteria bacterium]